MLSRIALLVCCVLGADAVAMPGVDLDRFDQSKQTITLPNGITLGYIDQGPRDGQPVVFVHGYTDSARDWAPLVPYLDPAFRVILVDIRGHGASSKPECCYTRVDFAYDVKLLLDALGIQRADIVGHSLGSIIGQTFAEYWPERTRRLVLVSSTGGPRKDCPRPPGKAGETMDFRSEIRKLSDPIDPDSPFMIEWWSSPTPVDPDFLRRQRVDAAHMPVNVWLAILDQGGLQGYDLQSTLPRIQAPTLLMWGLKDPIFGAQDRCSLRKGLPAATVHLFPTLGHNAFWEQPDAFAKILNPFLRAPL
jgi:pimeloyl-ACP methyl ester carboxylesterase